MLAREKPVAVRLLEEMRKEGSFGVGLLNVAVGSPA